MGSTVDDDVSRAVRALKAGLLVVFPTDTVYGLAARHDDPLAVAKLYEAKGRDDRKPLPILVSGLEQAARIGRLGAAAEKLARAFWPGPLTIVTDRAPSFSSDAMAGEQSVGLRMPNEPLALAVIEGAGGVLAVSSANRSGGADPRTVDAARKQLGEAVDVYLDGGPAPGDRGSTVVDARGNGFRVIRAGPISEEQIAAVLDG